MKKRGSLILAVLMLLIAGFAGCETEEPIGTVAKITTKKGSLNLRARPSLTSTVKDEIPNGSCLLVLEEGEEWCLCRWMEKTGYCRTEYLTFLREANVGILDYQILRQGDRGEDVLALKARLQELGYIRPGSILTESYNDILVERIVLFQRQIGVTEDGIASQELQFYLFSDKAPQCSQTLPNVRSRVKTEENGLNKEICGCCMGEGCECCGFRGWIFY